MSSHLFLLSVPGLRERDLASMPHTRALIANGEVASLTPSFPCVTWPVQANMLTGKLPGEHGVIANGFFWRDRHEVEMWTAWNDKIQAPQIWDILHQRDVKLTSAAWFPMLSKGCGADYVCMPAPIHNPDGSESLWCYTKPTPLYGEFRDLLGHFPLQHFWGPMANIKSTAWIADSAAVAAKRFRPNFFYVYLPHLDYAAQRTGPDSPAAHKAVQELDDVIGKLADEVRQGLGENPVWIIASEYAITPVDHVSYPNRILREAGCLRLRVEADGEHLDLVQSDAWALVDHQFSHVFVRDRNPATIRRVVDLFRGKEGFAEVLSGEERARRNVLHERAGDVVLISSPQSWQAYYWWLDDALAPSFARTVDIHRKPGYDPVELHVDMATKSIPLKPELVRGSHGAPAEQPGRMGVALCSQQGMFGGSAIRDIDVAPRVLRFFEAT